MLYLFDGRRDRKGLNRLDLGVINGNTLAAYNDPELANWSGRRDISRVSILNWSS